MSVAVIILTRSFTFFDWYEKFNIMLLQKAKLYQQKFIRFNILKVTFKPSVVNGMVNCLSIEISMVTNVTQCVEESDNFVGQGKV